MEKKIKPITYGLIILLVIGFLLSSIFIVGFNQIIYKHVYRTEPGISDFSGYTQFQYIEEIDRLHDYLFSLKRDDGLIDNIYSEDEVSHMQDVFNIFFMARIINLVSLLISILIIFFNRKRIYKIDISRKWYLFILIPIVIMLPAIINFDKFWILFHKVLFRNELWLMDPDTSLMINLLPQKVFYLISMGTIGMYSFFTLVANLMFRFYSKKQLEEI